MYSAVHSKCLFKMCAILCIQMFYFIKFSHAALVISSFTSLLILPLKLFFPSESILVISSFIVAKYNLRIPAHPLTSDSIVVT